MKAIKRWIRLASEESDTLIHRCFRAQLQKTISAIGRYKVKRVLERAGLGDVSPEMVENRGTREIERLISDRLSDIKRQDILAISAEKCSLVVQIHTSPYGDAKVTYTHLKGVQEGDTLGFRLGGWMQRRMKRFRMINGICVIVRVIEKIGSTSC